MGFGDWIKGLFGKKDTAADSGATSSDANGKPAEPEAAPSAAEADSGQPNAPDAP